jgi:hypothetical protein
MQDIQQQATERYLKNVAFLKKEHYELWYQLELLQNPIDGTTPKEHYALEYKEDGYFDVVELSSGGYLYADNSDHISQQLAQRVNYKKDSYVFDGLQMYDGYENIKEMNDHIIGFEDIFPLMSYYLKHTTPTQEMKSIEKFIYIGVGLGGHLIKIDEMISADEYLIIEDDLELFHLSLFVTPYFQLNKSKLIFCVGQSQKTFTTIFQKFLSDSFFKNKYLKYSLFPAHSDETIKHIKNVLASQDFMTFPYKTLLSKYLKPLSYIQKGYKTLDLSKQFNATPLTNKPLLIVASGPSLDSNLEWLKDNHANFCILALSATLKVLSKNNITPDIVTHLDGFASSMQHFKGIDKNHYLKNTLALFGSFTPLEATEYFTKENVYFTEDLPTQYHKEISALSGPDVGSTSIMWATTLGFEQIYLLGIDFALSDDGQSHSKTHQLTKTKYATKDMNTTSESISFREDFFPIKGNFKEKVYTTPLFYGSIQALYHALPLIKKEAQTIFNLNDGAYIDNTIPLKTNDIPHLQKLEKQSLLLSLHTHLQPHTYKELTSDDLHSLKQRLVFTLKTSGTLQNYNKAPLSLHTDDYLYNLISLMLALLVPYTRENRNLVDVYDYYLSYCAPIVFDFFNTKGVKNTKKHIKNIDMMVLKGLFEIEHIYEEGLKQFLQEKN